MKILGKEFDFDFYDADQMEKVENAIQKVEEETKKLNNLKQQKSSEVIRKTCKILFDFFDTCLGKNASKEIFGEKTSLTLCVKAYEDFINAKKEIEKQFEDISKRYTPNRVSKRKAK